MLPLIFLFIFGLLIGSFLNVVILRLPQDEPLTGRSHCPNCGHILSPIELVPVFSYLFLRGKCSSCHERISPRYMIIELLCGLLFFFAGWKLGVGNALQIAWVAKACIVSAVLLVVFVVDMEHYIILDRVLLVAALLLLCVNIVIDVLHPSGGWLRTMTVKSALAGLAGAFPFFVLWFMSNGKWMGFGDVKLVVVLGLSVSWPLIWVNLFLAFFMGAAYSVVPLILGQKTLGSKVPFGTFLSLAALVVFYFGSGMLLWYLRLIGWSA